MATLWARGELAVGADFVHGGLLGTTFTGRLEEEVGVRKRLTRRGGGGEGGEGGQRCRRWVLRKKRIRTFVWLIQPLRVCVRA
jgi:hypothetical protein